MDQILPVPIEAGIVNATDALSELETSSALIKETQESHRPDVILTETQYGSTFSDVGSNSTIEVRQSGSSLDVLKNSTAHIAQTGPSFTHIGAGARITVSNVGFQVVHQALNQDKDDVRGYEHPPLMHIHYSGEMIHVGHFGWLPFHKWRGLLSGDSMPFIKVLAKLYVKGCLMDFSLSGQAQDVYQYPEDKIKTLLKMLRVYLAHQEHEPFDVTSQEYESEFALNCPAANTRYTTLTTKQPQPQQPGQSEQPGGQPGRQPEHQPGQPEHQPGQPEHQPGQPEQPHQQVFYLRAITEAMEERRSERK